MSWSFEVQPYAGRVLLISGRDESQHNAWRLFAQPDLAWRRAFAEAEFVEVPGSFAFEQRSMPELSRLLTAQMRAAMSAAPVVMPADAYQARVIVDGLPQRTKPLQRFSIGVTVKNDSDLTWRATQQSGLTVGIRWTDADGDVIPRAGERSNLPEIAPHGEASTSLDIETPSEAGAFRLHVDICEEGNRWFNADPAKALSTDITVERPSPSPQRARRSFWPLRRQTHRYAFGFDSPGLELLTFGWGAAEEWGTWSVRRRAKLRLPLADRHGRWRARLTCQAFGPHEASVPVLVRPGYDGAETLWSLRANVTISQVIDIDCPGTDITLQFKVPDALSPRALGYSADPRRLGIGLVALQLMPI